MITIEKAMEHLSSQEKQEAERLFGIALEYAEQKDFSCSAEYYAKAAAYGHPGAQNNLGRLYENGNGVSEDKKKAFELYLEAAKHGSCAAMRNIIYLYLHGTGIERDYDAANEWIDTLIKEDILASDDLDNEDYRWEYKNDEKKLYRHKMAAEYGNVDSMFLLGNYYAIQGDHQDTTLAAYYYDCAGKAGTPEMKLKVAKAFDLPKVSMVFRENEPALDLEKAKYWYNEVWACGDNALKLKAAKGLDEGIHEGKVLRPALDMNRAYMTYRTLAMSGNKESCALAAYCSETGKGTIHNIDIAITLYEKAGYKEEANRCRRMKEANMPPIEGEVHSQYKEYYSEDVNATLCEYDEKIYRLVPSWSDFSFHYWVCSSDVNGEEIKILAELRESPTFMRVPYVHVNVTGIYIYNMRPTGLQIQHLDFDGRLISEIDDGKEYTATNIYIYDNRVYFVYTPMSDSEKVCQIRCMYVDEKRIEILYEKAASIKRLFAAENKLVFLAKYENREHDCEKQGWMILDLIENSVECLSNPYCSLENVIDNPEIYDPKSLKYDKRTEHNRSIKFFDLKRSIFWEEHGVYWKAHRLWEDRDDLIENIPAWYMENQMVQREYFDGTHHYFTSDSSELYASNQIGKIYDWSIDKYGDAIYGDFKDFQISGNHLYAEMKQYPLVFEASKPIIEFEYLINRDLVEAFEKSKSQSEPKLEPESERNAMDAFDAFLKQAIEKEQKQTEPEPKPDIVSDWDPFNDLDSDRDLFDDSSFDENLFDDSIFDGSPFGEDIKSAPPAKAKKTVPTGERADHDMSVEKIIGSTDIKYNICTFGAKFHIGFGVPVTIRINGNEYKAKMHNKTKGRVDGIKKLYKENGIEQGDRLKAFYLSAEQAIELEKIK